MISRLIVTFGGLALALVALLLMRGNAPVPTAAASTTTYNWLQFGGNAQHSLNNTFETTISTANVAGLQQVWQVNLQTQANGAPTYLSGVTTATGVRNLLFLTSQNGTITALDANTGATIWSQAFGNCCTVKSTPAIDPNLNFVYTYGGDGFVHKLQVGDGIEVTGGGWPELVSLKPTAEEGSSGLTIATAKNGTEYLYASVANQFDAGDYQGHLVTINLATGSQFVFNILCSNQVNVHFVNSPGTPDCPLGQAGAWARGSVLYNPDLDKVFVSTSNGVWNPSLFYWGDSVLELNPDGTSAAGGIPLDSYTPSNQYFLNVGDIDLGSTSVVRLAPPPNSPVQHLGLQVGKDGELRLLNLDNLSGKGGAGHLGGEISPLTLVPDGPSPTLPVDVRAQPATWRNPADQSTWVFIDNQNGLNGFQLQLSVTNTLSLQPMWGNFCGCTLPDLNSPLIANGVLYVANAHDLQALDPLTGNVLWNGTSIGGINAQSPIVVNGMVYVSDGNKGVTAFGLPGNFANSYAYHNHHANANAAPEPVDTNANPNTAVRESRLSVSLAPST